MDLRVHKEFCFWDTLDSGCEAVFAADLMVVLEVLMAWSSGSRGVWVGHSGGKCQGFRC